jgi:hypothetical protein
MWSDMIILSSGMIKMINGMIIMLRRMILMWSGMNIMLSRMIIMLSGMIIMLGSSWQLFQIKKIVLYKCYHTKLLEICNSMEQILLDIWHLLNVLGAIFYGLSEKICQSAEQVSVLQKCPGAKQFLLSRQVQVQLRPLWRGDTSMCCRGPCGVDMSMYSSGLCSVGTSRSGTCSFCSYKSRCCSFVPTLSRSKKDELVYQKN